MTLGDLTVPHGRLRVVFKTSHIEGNARCKSWLLPYQQAGDRLTIQGHQPGGCERDNLHDELAFSEIMAGDVKIAQSSPAERLLVGRAGSIRLVRPWLEPARN